MQLTSPEITLFKNLQYDISSTLNHIEGTLANKIAKNNQVQIVSLAFEAVNNYTISDMTCVKYGKVINAHMIISNNGTEFPRGSAMIGFVGNLYPTLNQSFTCGTATVISGMPGNASGTITATLYTSGMLLNNNNSIVREIYINLNFIARD